MIFRAGIDEGCVRGRAEERDAGTGFIEQDEVRTSGCGCGEEEGGGDTGAESNDPSEQTSGMKV
jgi:hypothetical protein